MATTTFNQRKRDLNALSVNMDLGDVDAFLSHSWTDGKTPEGLDEKWARLEEWRALFNKENGGKEPIVWLDSACLDQKNIDQSLTFLPCFLSGCKKLVIIPGETYTSRLWCIMELFTFLLASGSEDVNKDVLIYPMTPANDPVGKLKAMTSLIDKFQTFDGKKANCWRESEREQLQSIIERGFGKMDKFNTNVRTRCARA